VRRYSLGQHSCSWSNPEEVGGAPATGGSGDGVNEGEFAAAFEF